MSMGMGETRPPTGVKEGMQTSRPEGEEIKNIKEKPQMQAVYRKVQEGSTSVADPKSLTKKKLAKTTTN